MFRSSIALLLLMAVPLHGILVATGVGGTACICDHLTGNTATECKHCEHTQEQPDAIAASNSHCSPPANTQDSEQHNHHQHSHPKPLQDPLDPPNPEHGSHSSHCDTACMIYQSQAPAIEPSITQYDLATIPLGRLKLLPGNTISRRQLSHIFARGPPNI